MKQKKSLKNHKRLNIKKIILFLLIIIFAIYLLYKYNYLLLENNIISNVGNINNLNSKTSEYGIVKQDKNSNYSGIGQEKVKNKDGYLTTFTTSEPNKKTYKEYKQNGNSSWANNHYWGDTMAENGCGITVMSIVLSGYNKKYTPEDLRKKYYPVMNYENFSYELSNTFGIKNSDFYYDSVHLSDKSIMNHLETNKPIIVCVWNKPTDNRWTTASHYMVLLATDGNNMIYVSNPNGLENDSKSSGWYDIDEITPYLAKALYIES